jgi:hypothetical protein
MSRYEHKKFSSPDETRKFAKGKVDLVNIGNGAVGKFTLEPGWRWSVDVKPQAGTDLCEIAHFQYLMSGRIAVKMSDGQQFEHGPGEVVAIPPGHDAWVVGNEPVVAIDWTGAMNYAKPVESANRARK